MSNFLGALVVAVVVGLLVVYIAVYAGSFIALGLRRWWKR